MQARTAEAQRILGLANATKDVKKEEAEGTRDILRQSGILLENEKEADDTIDSEDVLSSTDSPSDEEQGEAPPKPAAARA